MVGVGYYLWWDPGAQFHVKVLKLSKICEKCILRRYHKKTVKNFIILGVDRNE